MYIKPLFLKLLQAGLAVFLFCNTAMAQLHAELKENPKFVRTIEQLWQLKVTNFGTQTEHAQISVELNDSQNQLIYSGSSRAQELQSGIRILNRVACLPISDEQSDPAAFPLKPGIYYFKFKLMDAGTNQMLFSGGFTMDTRAVKSGLAALTKNKIRFGGSASVAGQQSDFSGLNTEVPANYTRVMFNPTLTLWEVPITLNYLYSTENTPNRQPINQFSVQFDAYQYRANLEAKLLQKVEQVKTFKNPLELKNLDDYKSKLKANSGKQLKKLSGKYNLDSIEAKIKEGENIDKVLESPDMKMQLYRLNVLCKKHNLRTEVDIDDDDDTKMSKDEKKETRRLFALKKQNDNLKKRKRQTDKLKKKHEKALQLKQKINAIENGNLATSFQNAGNLKSGLKRFGMMDFGTKILSSINTLTIGTAYPYFSEQTLNGARVDGFQFEANPGYVYLNVAMGKSAIKAFESTFSRKSYSPEQNLTAIKTGIGKKEASHFFLTGIQIKDVNDDAPERTFTPRENYILGTDLQLSLLNKTVLMGGEVNGSIYTTDQNANPLPFKITEKIPQRFPFDTEIEKRLNSSSKLGYAYSGYTNLLLNDNTTTIAAKFSHIEPSYYSLGNEFLLKDREAIQINASQSLYKNKFTITGYFEQNNNGLQPYSTLFKTVYTRYGTSIRVNSKMATVMVNYAPYFQSVSSFNDSGNYTNTGQMLTTNIMFKYQLSKKIQAQTMVGNTYQKLTGLVKAEVSSFSFMQNVNSPIAGLQVNATYSPNQNIGGQSKNALTANLNGTVRLFKTWSNTIGYIYYNYQDIESKSGFYFLSQYPITSNILLDISISRNTYQNGINTSLNFSELYFRYGIKLQL